MLMAKRWSLHRGKRQRRFIGALPVPLDGRGADADSSHKLIGDRRPRRITETVITGTPKWLATTIRSPTCGVRSFATGMKSRWWASPAV